MATRTTITRERNGEYSVEEHDGWPNRADMQQDRDEWVHVEIDTDEAYGVPDIAYNVEEQVRTSAGCIVIVGLGGGVLGALALGAAELVRWLA